MAGGWFGGLVLLYRVGWGYYARFWKDKSPVFMGCLAVLGWSGGLTGLRGCRGERVGFRESRSLICRRFLDVINDISINRAMLSFQLQTKLLLDGCVDTW